MTNVESELVALSGLRDIADRYDGFILDLWGVIHDGVTPYAGAKDTLSRLRDLGKKTVLLSNAPRRASSLVAMMSRMGLGRELYDHVLSSGEAVYQELSERRDPWFAALGRLCFHVGPAYEAALFDGLGLDLVTDIDRAEFLVVTGPDSFDETVEDFAHILGAAAVRRLPMVCANPDLVVMRQGRPLVCAGALARHYERIGGQVCYRGKPDPAIYRTCLALLGVGERSRVLAVGDALHTDVAGAHAAGFDSLLCTAGIHAAEIGAAHGERPDLARVDAVVAAHGGPRPNAVIGGFVW